MKTFTWHPVTGLWVAAGSRLSSVTVPPEPGPAADALAMAIRHRIYGCHHLARALAPGFAAAHLDRRPVRTRPADPQQPRIVTKKPDALHH